MCLHPAYLLATAKAVAFNRTVLEAAH